LITDMPTEMLGSTGYERSLTVIDKNGYRTTLAARAFKIGEIIFPVIGASVDKPTVYTIQISADRHVLSVYGKNINHSCCPNCRFDPLQLVFRALRDIAAGEELTFDYNTTEYELFRPFKCHCNSVNCLKYIRGYKHLTAEQRRLLAPLTADHLRSEGKAFTAAGPLEAMAGTLQKLLRISHLRESLHRSFFWMNGHGREKKKFKRITGHELNLNNPLSYAEKLVWKKIYDRNPLLPIIADKFLVRGYLKDFLGEKEAESVLVPLLYVTDEPDTIPFDRLPKGYVIKPNHASGRYFIIEKSTVIDRGLIIRKCKEWLRRAYGLRSHQWAYQSIKRKILIEELLCEEDGGLPTEYKFFIFHGKCHLILVVYDRFVGTNYAYYTPEWERVNIQGPFKQADQKQRPGSLDVMIHLAETLGAHLDAIRVDLYLAKNRIYFGEMTNYNEGGYVNWTSISHHFEFGSKWKIVPGYWEQDEYIKRLYKHKDWDGSIDWKLNPSLPKSGCYR
jgi:hypothetical protein